MISSLLTKPFLALLENTYKGSLRLTLPHGKTHTFEGAAPGPRADMHILNTRCIQKMAWRGSLGLGDAWVKKMWTTSDLSACLEFFLKNAAMFTPRYQYGILLPRVVERAKYVLQSNTRRGSRRNIHLHYDLGNDFYRQWLDATMSYSSALFDTKSKTLQTAQENKIDRIIDKLPNNSSILEIGCGWGSFIRRAVAKGHRVEGITLSQEQEHWAREKTRDLGKDARVALRDYRDTEGSYDAVVSIEMYEAVGEAYWRQYFAKIAQVLKRNGTAVIQAITVSDAEFESYRRDTDFIRSYIFPGGMLASKQRFLEEARAAGLQVADFFSFGKSYAKTLEMWLENFNAAWQQVAELGFDERFARIWQYYLAGCRASFLSGCVDVSQIQLRHAR